MLVNFLVIIAGLDFTGSVGMARVDFLGCHGERPPIPGIGGQRDTIEVHDRKNFPEVFLNLDDDFEMEVE